MNKNKLHLSILTLCFLLVTGCSSFNRSEFELPSVEIPDNWPQQSESLSLSADAEQWWKQFNDAQLNSLIERALQTNNDLALATLNLRKARIKAGLSDEDKSPDFSFTANSSNEKSFDSGDSDNSYSTTMELSYELDLWGQFSAAADVTQWAAKASFEERESVAQSLVATVASLYWKIGYLNQYLALVQANIEGTEQTIALTKVRYDNGSTTRLAVLESTQNLYKQQINASQLQQQLTESKHALAILLNQPPENVSLSIEKLAQSKLAQIAPGIPADLLLRRPDVKAALYQLKSMLANKDAVAASYLPSLSLTGELGTSSSDLIELLQNPVGKLGASLSLPFLSWNKMQLNKKVSELDYQSAVINYRVTLYQAFEEVANYLSAREHYYYQDQALQAQYTNSQAVEKIYASQYRAGAIAIIDWINAIEAKRDAQASLLENQYNQFVIQAKLYQALGGQNIAPTMQSSKK